MIEFDITNIDELLKAYHPSTVDKALKSAINKTANKTATVVSKAVRAEYMIKASDVRANMTVLRTKFNSAQGQYERVLMYQGGRISLMYFNPIETRFSGRGSSHTIITKRMKDGLGASRRKSRRKDLRGVTVHVKRSKGRKLVKGDNEYGAFIAQGRRGGGGIKGGGGGGFGRPDGLFNLSALKQGRGNVQLFMRETRSRLPISRRASLSVPQMVENTNSQQSIDRFVNSELPQQFAHAMDFYLGKINNGGGDD